jgi:hypothetical protein
MRSHLISWVCLPDDRAFKLVDQRKSKQPQTSAFASGILFLNLGIAYRDLKDSPDTTTALRSALHSRLPMKEITHSAKAMQEIMVSLRLAPSDSEEGNMKSRHLH